MSNPYTTTDATAQEWLNENGSELSDLQQTIETDILTYNGAVQIYNASRGSGPTLSEISNTILSGGEQSKQTSANYVKVLNEYQEIKGGATDAEWDKAREYVDGIESSNPQLYDTLNDQLEEIKNWCAGSSCATNILSDIADAAVDIKDLQQDLEEFLRGDAEEEALENGEAGDDDESIEDGAAAAADDEADAARADIDAVDPLVLAELQADYPKMTFLEQCYLLSKIFPLVKYKKLLDEQTKTATGYSKKLPYVSDDNNASLGINGNPYAFINRLVQHPSQASFFNMKTSQISSLQPMIRLYKVDMKDNAEAEQEFMFNAYASKSEVESLFDNKAKRGFGVGIKNFSFTYDGNNPFAAKKSIKAQLTLFASSFDELIVNRGSETNPYRYTDLALKTGLNTDYTMSTDADASAECQERAAAARTNLEALTFRLKAVVGFARPAGDTSALFPAVSDTEKNAVLEAIGESSVTLNLTPTVHEIKIDDMGRVNFVCNYLAYAEDFLDQTAFDVFYNESAAANIMKRKYEYENATQDCSENTLGTLKKGWAESGVIRKDKFLNLQSLMQNLVEQGKMRNLKISFNEAITSTILGPFDEKTTGGTIDGTSSASEADIKSGLEISSATQEEAEATEATEIEEATPTSIGQHVSFFYVSDLLDIILAGINKRLALFTDRGVWNGFVAEGVEIETSDIDREIERYKKFQEGFKKFRILLGPLEIVNAQNSTETENVNFGDVPISAKYFMSWLTQKMLKTQQPQYNLASFLNDFFNTLLRDFLNNDDCFGGFSTKQKTRLNQAAITSYKSGDHDEITEWIMDPTLGNGEADIAQMNQPVLNVSGPQNLPNPAGALADEINYLVFFAARTQPEELMKGERSEDEKQGIFHYLLGLSRGIVKKISLSKTDAKYLKEVRLEQEGFQGLSQLREVYDATVECYANVKTFPGTYIYVDPRSFAPNTLTYGDPTLDLTMFGIGGYYMIIRAEHNFGPGTANTKLTAKWVAQLEHDDDCNLSRASDKGDGSATKCAPADSNSGV